MSQERTQSTQEDLIACPILWHIEYADEENPYKRGRIEIGHSVFHHGPITIIPFHEINSGILFRIEMEDPIAVRDLIQFTLTKNGKELSLSEDERLFFATLFLCIEQGLGIMALTGFDFIPFVGSVDYYAGKLLNPQERVMLNAPKFDCKV